MEIFKKQLNIHLFKIIIVCVILTICILAVIYYNSDASSRVTLILGGMITGLAVALLQILLMWTEHKEMEKIKKLRIKKILDYRDDENIYKKVIEKTKKEIWVLGNTASRFMTDFANEDRPDKKALIDALNRKVHVRFLLPEQKHLWNSNDKRRATISLNSITKLQAKYPNLIELKYYPHAPFHSMVLMDSDCFVGPIFPDKSSKDTPTIYTDKSSVFAKSYHEYFEYEWKTAQPCKTQ